MCFSRLWLEKEQTTAMTKKASEFASPALLPVVQSSRRIDHPVLKIEKLVCELLDTSKPRWWKRSKPV